jgi:hypothetical protein
MEMPNYLKMPKKAQVLALLALGWSYRRIQADTGVRRETVGRYDRVRSGNAAKTFAGFAPSPPSESPDLSSAVDSNAAKTFAGSDSKRPKRSPAQPRAHGSPRRPIAQRSPRNSTRV